MSSNDTQISNNMYRTPRIYTGQKIYRGYKPRRHYWPRRSNTTSYKPYKKYSLSYKGADSSPIEALLKLVGVAVYLLMKSIFWLFKQIFRSGTKIKEGSFAINPEWQAFNDKIQKVRENNEARAATLPVTADKQTEDDKRYGLKTSLLTPTEKDFLNILEQVVEDRYTIATQVPLSGIVTILDSNKNFTNYHDFNLIKAKTIDFVLYDKDYKPQLCIELDDRSHLRWDRIKRDAFINDLMKSVGLRIIHIHPAYLYDDEDLKEQIFKQ